MVKSYPEGNIVFHEFFFSPLFVWVTLNAFKLCSVILHMNCWFHLLIIFHCKLADSHSIFVRVFKWQIFTVTDAALSSPLNPRDDDFHSNFKSLVKHCLLIDLFFQDSEETNCRICPVLGITHWLAKNKHFAQKKVPLLIECEWRFVYCVGQISSGQFF